MFFKNVGSPRGCQAKVIEKIKSTANKLHKNIYLCYVIDNYIFSDAFNVTNSNFIIL